MGLGACGLQRQTLGGRPRPTDCRRAGEHAKQCTSSPAGWAFPRTQLVQPINKSPAQPANDDRGLTATRANRRFDTLASCSPKAAVEPTDWATRRAQAVAIAGDARGRLSRADAMPTRDVSAKRRHAKAVGCGRYAGSFGSQLRANFKERMTLESWRRNPGRGLQGSLGQARVCPQAPAGVRSLCPEPFRLTASGCAGLLSPTPQRSWGGVGLCSARVPRLDGALWAGMEPRQNARAAPPPAGAQGTTCAQGLRPSGGVWAGAAGPKVSQKPQAASSPRVAGRGQRASLRPFPAPAASGWVTLGGPLTAPAGPAKLGQPVQVS